MNAHEVVVLVELKALGEHREELVKLLTEILERSRIAPECLSYELFNRTDDDNTLLLFQTWGTQEAFETNWVYIDAPKITPIRACLGLLLRRANFKSSCERSSACSDRLKHRASNSVIMPLTLKNQCQRISGRISPVRVLVPVLGWRATVS